MEVIIRALLAPLLFALAGLLAACDAASSASATPTLDQREQAWLEQKITSYRIEVLVVRSVWHAQSHQITVRDGQIETATATCIPAPAEAGQCDVEDFDADDYTVAGLFRQAQTQSQSEYAPWVVITYDSRYGFPGHISYNHPDLLDEDWSWRVTAFEALK